MGRRRLAHLWFPHLRTVEARTVTEALEITGEEPEHGVGILTTEQIVEGLCIDANLPVTVLH